MQEEEEGNTLVAEYTHGIDTADQMRATDDLTDLPRPPLIPFSEPKPSSKRSHDDDRMDANSNGSKKKTKRNN